MKKDWFRPMKRLHFACFLILLAFIIPQHADAAISDDGTPFYDDPQINDFRSLVDDSLVATVACQVYYDHLLGPFVYTYQITNTSTAGISFFSVNILGADEP